MKPNMKKGALTELQTVSNILSVDGEEIPGQLPPPCLLISFLGSISSLPAHPPTQHIWYQIETEAAHEPHDTWKTLLGSEDVELRCRYSDVAGLATSQGLDRD